MAESSEDVKPGSEQLTIWFVSLRGGASLWPLLTCARKQQAAAVQPWPATAFWRRRGTSPPAQPSPAHQRSSQLLVHSPATAGRPPSPCCSIQLPDSSAPLKMKVKRSTKFEKVSARAQRSPPPPTHTRPRALARCATLRPPHLKAAHPNPHHPLPRLQIFGAFYKNKNMAPGSVTCACLSLPSAPAPPPAMPPPHPPMGPAPPPPPQYLCRCLAVLREGKKIEDTDTPESLEMDEGEVVDAQLQQTGGC